MAERSMKLRFAPSPTGYLHVGGARTAIFNYLHARRHGGTFLLRIEDTDVERSKQHHAEQIVASLDWLGVAWDENPVYQSDRLPKYRALAEELVAAGKAYRCFCTVEELDGERQTAERVGRAYRYSGRCRTRGDSPDRRSSHVIRFHVPAEPIEFHDLIRGDVRFDGELIDDFVLLRSDGNPTYHLSVVVDDIDMGITLVARGDDHLSNTPKHVLLFKAFESPIPQFAHVPLILGADRKRLSKRFGATSVEEYRSQGILPAALFNFLALLGWSPGANREILSRDEAVELFDLSEVHKSAAVFDQEKLLWLNAQYLNQMTADEIEPHLRPFLTFECSDREQLLGLIRMYQPRTRTLRDLATAISLYFSDDEELSYEEAAIAKHLKSDGSNERLSELRDLLGSVEPFAIDSTEKAVRELAERKGLSAGKYIHPLRVALTGASASPPIFDVAVMLGRQKSVNRLDRLIRELPRLVRS